MTLEEAIMELQVVKSRFGNIELLVENLELNIMEECDELLPVQKKDGKMACIFINADRQAEL